MLFCCYSGCYSASANAVFRVYRDVYRGLFTHGPRMPVFLDTAVDTSVLDTAQLTG